VIIHSSRSTFDTRTSGPGHAQAPSDNGRVGSGVGQVPGRAPAGARLVGDPAIVQQLPRRDGPAMDRGPSARSPCVAFGWITGMALVRESDRTMAAGPLNSGRELPSGAGTEGLMEESGRVIRADR
jgi:hypothetical protein